MAKKNKGQDKPFKKVIARNKKARFDYFIDETYEAGLVLVGSEVKSLRDGKGNIVGAYGRIRGNEGWLIGAKIAEYPQANRNNHEPERDRKLLLKERELTKLHNAVERNGCTLVPLELYFNARGRVKLLLGVARGKKQHDKRHALRQADAKREVARAMRGRND